MFVYFNSNDTSICRYKNADKLVFDSIHFIVVFISHWKWSKNGRAAAALSQIRGRSDLCCFFVNFFAAAKRVPLQTPNKLKHIAVNSNAALMAYLHSIYDSFYSHKYIIVFWNDKTNRWRKKAKKRWSINIKILTFIVIITIRLYYPMHPYKWRKKQNRKWQ